MKWHETQWDIDSTFDWGTLSSYFITGSDARGLNIMNRVGLTGAEMDSCLRSLERLVTAGSFAVYVGVAKIDRVKMTERSQN